VIGVRVLKTHYDLDVWNKSIVLVSNIYKTTAKFPKEEIYGLTSQIKRASISIPSNIAEGASRQTNKEFIQFLYIALGSASEVETQLIIANNLGFINQYELSFLLNEFGKIKKMLNGLIKYLKDRDVK
jgi:four helix bundle protein